MQLLIGTPSYDGTVTIAYMRSVLETLDALSAHGVRAGFETPSYESLITRARNTIANAFLRQDEYTHLLFIDADIGFEAQTVLRYLEADKDVICGIYPVKHLDIAKLRRMPPDMNDLEAEAAALRYTVKFRKGFPVDDHGLIPLEYGSTGFMLIRRHVLEEMAGAYPQLLYHNSFINSEDEQYDNYAFFDTMIHPGTRDYLPEDYAFCKRWTDIGGVIHGDVMSRFTHSGGRVYEGNFPCLLRGLQEEE
ncbi:MAG: hypothetical protein ACLGQW_12170 [Acidobacteriota bacterium]